MVSQIHHIRFSLTMANKEQEGMPQCCKSGGYGCVSMRHKHAHLPSLRFTGPKACVYISQDFMERINLAFLSWLSAGTNTTLTLPPLLKNLACSPTQHCTVSCGHSPVPHHPLVKLGWAVPHTAPLWANPKTCFPEDVAECLNTVICCLLRQAPQLSRNLPHWER